MSITTRPAFLDLETLRQRMDRFITDLNGTPNLTLEPERLALDVKETDDTVTVTASVPGFKPDEINVDVSNGTLTIRGETTTEQEETTGHWHMRERKVGSVYRVITLPTTTSDADAKAVLNDGVLTVTMPKTDQKPTHRIEVEQP